VRTLHQVSAEADSTPSCETRDETANFRHLFALNATSLRTRMRSSGAPSDEDFPASFDGGVEALQDERFDENHRKMSNFLHKKY
jgi:hypothetical protein